VNAHIFKINDHNFNTIDGPLWEILGRKLPSNSQKNALKNTKDNSRKTGFSLVEMIVVIAIIGIIVAIVSPNAGSMNNSAHIANGQSNVQSVASVPNAAVAAGATLTCLTKISTGADMIDLAEAGVTPSDGTNKGKKFTVGAIDDDEEPVAAVYINFDRTHARVIYNTAASPYAF
jgi:prepilin-type N-terminal cleavage/methylation domain-containing protein